MMSPFQQRNFNVGQVKTCLLTIPLYIYRMDLDIQGKLLNKGALYGNSIVTSPPLDTNMGYKIEVVVLYSHIAAVDPFITLGFTIKKGKDDARLPWPFQQNVRYEFVPIHPRCLQPVREVDLNLQPYLWRPELKRPLEDSNHTLFVERLYVRDIKDLLIDGKIKMNVIVDNQLVI